MDTVVDGGDAPSASEAESNWTWKIDAIMLDDGYKHKTKHLRRNTWYGCETTGVGQNRTCGIRIGLLYIFPFSPA